MEANMKVKIGGCGVDKDGKPYKLPEVESELPDDWFERLKAVFGKPEAPKPK